MARPSPAEFHGAVLHSSVQGHERRLIFRGDDDRGRWLENVGEMHEQFGVLVHAFTTMPNRYHAVIETPRPDLSQAMGWLQTTYTIRSHCCGCVSSRSRLPHSRCRSLVSTCTCQLSQLPFLPSPKGNSCPLNASAAMLKVHDKYPSDEINRYAVFGAFRVNKEETRP